MRVRTSLLLSILVVLPLMVASACSTTDCSSSEPTQPEAEFLGTAIAVTDDEVTFGVDEVLVGQLGSTVAVRYLDDSGHYLHPGREYHVRAWRGSDGDDPGALTSSVKTAQSCGGGTVNADGSDINTGVLRGLSEWIPLMVILVPVTTIVLVVLHRIGVLVRGRRRVRKPVSRSR